MFQHQGVWLPDGEAHFPGWMDKHGEIVDGRGTYQLKKWRACLPWIKDFRVAVDVGAHVGFWAHQMAQKFELVHCFEPVSEFRYCLFENMKWAANFVVHPEALGAKPGRVVMKTPALDGGIDSGGTHVERAAAVNDEDPAVVEMRALDSYGFEKLDFLKLDCEGYEEQVLLGATMTLHRWKPCVIVEQKPHKLKPNFGIDGTPACDLLRRMGAKQRAVISGDYIFSW